MGSRRKGERGAGAGNATRPRADTVPVGRFQRLGRWLDKHLIEDWREFPRFASTYGLALLAILPVARENIELVHAYLPGPVYAKVMFILSVGTFIARIARQGGK